METFPESKFDPTTDLPEMHVEQTLRIVGHVQRIARERGWRFLTSTPPSEVDLVGYKVTPESIREFYKTPSEAPVFQDGPRFAVWVGEGTPEPTEGPFAEEKEKETTTNGNGATYTAAPPEAWAGGATIPSWRYVSCAIAATEKDVRAKLGAPDNAPVRFHADGDLAAVWFGPLPPTKPAFPGVGKERWPTPEPQKAAREKEREPQPNAKLAVKLLKLARNKVFSKKARALLERAALQFLK